MTIKITCPDGTVVAAPKLYRAHGVSSDLFSKRIELGVDPYAAATTPRKTIDLRGASQSPLYDVWSGMKARCYDRKSVSYKSHGARGITICARWLESFETFAADIGKRPFDGAQIDRIDNAGNYEPSNCRWATRDEQARNKRNNVWLEFRGVRMVAIDALRITGNTISVSCVHNRLRRGMSAEDAVTLPARTSRKAA